MDISAAACVSICTTQSYRVNVTQRGSHVINGRQSLEFETLVNRGQLVSGNGEFRYPHHPQLALRPSAKPLKYGPGSGGLD
jgi:hypothetical protein